MAIVRRGKIHLKVVGLFGDASRSKNSVSRNLVSEHRSDGGIDHIFRRAPGDTGAGKTRARSLKDALEMPIPGFHVDLDELIGPCDELALPPPINFSASDYQV